MNLKIPENPSRKITQTHSRVTKKSRKRFYTAWVISGRFYDSRPNVRFRG